MDIKNILNDVERRAAQITPPILSPPIATSSTPATPATPAPAVLKPPNSPLPPSASASASAPASAPASASAPQYIPSHSSQNPTQQMPPPPPPPLLPQQIVYTGPVYQLQPAVEVRHMGDAIHYRYAPYPTYEEPRHVDYAVYQEYAEIPLHHTASRNHDPRYNRPHTSSRVTPTRPTRLPDSRHPPMPLPETSDLSHPRVRPREQLRNYPRNRDTDAHVPRPRVIKIDDEIYGADSADDSLTQPRTQRRGRNVSYSEEHQRDRVFRRGTIPRPYAGSSSAGERRTEPNGPFGSDQHREDPLYQHRNTDPFRRYSEYVSYHGPNYADMRTVREYASPHAEQPRNFETYSADPVHDYQPYQDSDRQVRGRLHAPADPSFRPVDTDMEPSSDLHLDPDFSSEDDAPIISNGRRPKKRERGTRPTHSRHSPARNDLRNLAHAVDDIEDMAEAGEESEDCTPYNPDFLRAPSVEHDSSKELDRSRCNLATLRVPTKSKQGRMRAKSRPVAVDHLQQKRPEMWSSEADASQKKKRVKHEKKVTPPAKPCVPVKSEKRDSPVSIEAGSPTLVKVEQKPALPSSKQPTFKAERVIVIGDDSPTISDHDEGTFSRDHDIAKSLAEIEAWSKEHDQDDFEQPQQEDPDEPYPQTLQDFSGIPAKAVGDLLQLWEFVTSFAKTMRISPFKLWHLEQAIVHKERSSLIDACLTRLVRAILGDTGLVDELGIPDSLVKKLTTKGTKNLAALILDALPDILSFESDDVDDRFLHSSVAKLASSNDKWTFYRTLEPAGKLRILRELVDYAAMTDTLRECVTDTMEHAEEERKRAREENSANRKKLEQQIRDHKAELQDYRVKHGLLETPADSDKEKAGQEVKIGQEGKEGQEMKADQAAESDQVSTKGKEANAAQYVKVGEDGDGVSTGQEVGAGQKVGVGKDGQEVTTGQEVKAGQTVKVCKDVAAEGGSEERCLTRQEKLIAAQKERKEEEERRVIERGAEAIMAKIEKDRASLKTLKNLRLRNRASISAREGELFNASVAAPNMPFTAPHEDPVRSHPIGTDRDNRCYWFFEGSGRIWIEDTSNSEWSVLKDSESLDMLLRWLSPYRKEEKILKKTISSRRDIIVAEMRREAKEMELAKAEAQKAQELALEILPRSTRAGKRRAESKRQKAKAKKSKQVGSFLEYRNSEK